MSFVCPKKVEFVATATLKEKPQEPKYEQKDKEDKNKDDVKTSSFTNANVFMSMGGFICCGCWCSNVMETEKEEISISLIED